MVAEKGHARQYLHGISDKTFALWFCVKAVRVRPCTTLALFVPRVTRFDFSRKTFELWVCGLPRPSGLVWICPFRRRYFAECMLYSRMFWYCFMDSGSELRSGVIFGTLSDWWTWDSVCRSEEHLRSLSWQTVVSAIQTRIKEEDRSRFTVDRGTST